MNDKFSCPHCRQPLEIPGELLGQSVECPKCKGRIKLPSADSPTTRNRVIKSEAKQGVCYQCGHELKKGVKFCTSCGAKSKDTASLKLSIISMVVSAIGIIGFWVLMYLVLNLLESHYDQGMIYLRHLFRAITIPPVGIVIALVAQNKQKSLLGFVAGVIPCVHLVIVPIYVLMKIWR